MSYVNQGQESTLNSEASAITKSNTQQQETDIAFESGLNSDGTVARSDFWTYEGASATPAKWGEATAGVAGGIVTYEFDASSNWTSAERVALAAGLALWSAETNITFVQSTTSSADIDFVRLASGSDAAYTSTMSVQYSNNELATLTPMITINIDTSMFGSPADASYLGGTAIQTFVHEEGHAIGLGHAGSYNGTSGTDQYGQYDTKQYSIMSYNSAGNIVSWGNNVPTTPMLDDILSAQRLYGQAIGGPLSGNDVFGFNCNIGANLGMFFNFALNTQPVVTLYSSGLNNTLDLSGYTQVSQIIDLNAGTFSSVGGLTNNVAIAYGTEIDTAIGGQGGDTFILNDNSDTIDGQGGFNKAQAPLGKNDYIFSTQGDTVLATTASGVVDRFTNIFTLSFADGTSINLSSFVDPYLFGDGNTPLAYNGTTYGVPTVEIAGIKDQVQIGISGSTLNASSGSETASVALSSGPEYILYADGVDVVDISGNTGDVARVYQAVLGRLPDADGLVYWTTQIDRGTLGLNNMAASFLSSSEGLTMASQTTNGFIESIYQNSLGRQADATGLEFWANAIDSGALSKTDFVVDIAQSAEFQITTMQTDGSKIGSEIYRLYEVLLGRTPDQDGLQYWTGRMIDGLDENVLAADMAGMSELINSGSSNQAFVSQLYQQGLGRSADADGIDFWVSAIESGSISRSTAAVEFANSTEAQKLYAQVTHDNWTKTT